LSQLVRSGRLSRVRVEDRYLYCSNDSAQRKCQRQNRLHPTMDAAFAQATQTLFEVLDERQRRLYAGLESLRPDSGGDRIVADRLGMARATVTNGRKQRLSGKYERHQVRKPRGRRKRSDRNDQLLTYLGRRATRRGIHAADYDGRVAPRRRSHQPCRHMALPPHGVPNTQNFGLRSTRQPQETGWSFPSRPQPAV